MPSDDHSVLPTVTVDYNDVDSLTNILEEHNVHTVLCTFAISGNSLKTSQENLIKASAAASPVLRFIPTSYAIDYPRE